MGAAICEPSNTQYDTHYEHRDAYHKKYAYKAFKAAPGCSTSHPYDFLLTAEEGAMFKCFICSETQQASLGRYHCNACNIDVCKLCFEADDGRPNPNPNPNSNPTQSPNSNPPVETKPA